MEPALIYAINRKEALVASMVGAALATLPRHSGVLRGREDSMAASAVAPSEPEITKPVLEELSDKALGTLKEWQTMTHDVIAAVYSQITGQIVGQIGFHIGAAMHGALPVFLCKEKSGR